MHWFLQKIKGSVFNRTATGEILSLAHSLYLHLRYSFSDRAPGHDKQRLRFYLVKHCHIIEKGLALPAPRLGFGQPKIIDLIKKAEEYERLYSLDDATIMLRDMLRSYMKFHNENMYAFPEEFILLIKNFTSGVPSSQSGGLKHLEKRHWQNYSLEKFTKFVTHRHSVRDFCSTPIDDNQIRKVINTSLNTPSVCNRQGWQVHYYNDRQKIKQLLTYQNGNSGFTDAIHGLLIVTGNTKAFTRYEHNQLFIDGGLLSMNLMLALHAAGLGSCPLNTCMPFHKEVSLKKVAAIPKHEKLIMMIAVGNLKQEFSVAQSTKYHIDQVFRAH